MSKMKPNILIGLIGFDGVNALDIVGPSEAFATAGRADPMRRDSGSAYEICLLGCTAAAFSSESGMRFLPRCALADAPPLDTIIIPGGWGVRETATLQLLAGWLKRHAPGIRRVASVCTGIYALAAANLLDGRRATTHWRFVEDVARRHGRLRMEGDALFIKDGRYYTSGGITAGIDLALALIEEDLGPRAALAVARELVMYVKRDGGQDQYSEPLQFQVSSADSFGELVAWTQRHLDGDLSTDALAARAGLSTRHFSRRFVAAMGCTPAQFVETARLSTARDRLIASRKPVERVAASVGFQSADVFRRRFIRRFGIAPASYRQRFQPSTRGAEP
jgi:transcriptional regulator GlxA family with amidase domain